jgi:flagellar biosynthesis/type III secretory pathway protein FliH
MYMKFRNLLFRKHRKLIEERREKTSEWLSGYAVGIEAKQKQEFDEGFDKGYSEGHNDGRQVGQAEAKAAAITALKKGINNGQTINRKRSTDAGY